MAELRIGVQLKSLRQPLRAALRSAAELGARGVELDARTEVRPQEMSQTALRQLRKLLEDHRLAVCAIGFSTRRGYGNLDELDRRVEATRQVMQMAHALGTPFVINQVGRVPEKSEGSEWETLTEVLRELGEYAHRVGAMLCADTGSESGADLLRLVQALPDGALGVNFNPGNLVSNEHSALEAAQVLGPYVRHVHAVDGVRDLSKGRGMEVELGRGAVDFPEIIATLEEHGYRGYYTVARDGASDPLGEAARAIRYLRSL